MNTQNYLDQLNKASNEIHKHMENQSYVIYQCVFCLEPMKQTWIQDSVTLTPNCNCKQEAKHPGDSLPLGSFF